ASDQAGDRGDVDYASAIPFEHLAPNALAEQEGSGEIDVDDRLPFLQRHILGRSAPRDARVVDQYVDLAKRLNRPVNNRLNVIGIGDVAQHPLAPVTAAAEVFHGWRQPLLPSGKQHERGSGFGQPFGHLVAKSPGTTGDYGYSAGEIKEPEKIW